MSTSLSHLDIALEVFGRLGIPVRKEHLGGSGGGLCTLRSQQVLFVDLDADVETQLDVCLRELASIPRTSAIYLVPALRERLESHTPSE